MGTMAVATVASLVRSMDESEQRELVQELRQIVGSALWEELAGVTYSPSPTTTPRAKRKSHTSYRHHWMKQVNEIDRSKKRGMDQVVGDWVDDMDGITNSNRPVLMGLSALPKSYAVLTYRKGASATLADSQGTRADIADAEVILEPTTFAKAVDHIEELLTN